MKSNQASNNADLNQAQSKHPPCPLWKKVVAGVLVVTAIALALPGTVWLDRLDFSWIDMFKGLAVSFGYSIGLVLAGIALVTAFLWVISRSGSIMNRGKAAIEYMVHCYPQQIKSRILHH